jgi:hypothetical protein
MKGKDCVLSGSVAVLTFGCILGLFFVLGRGNAEHKAPCEIKSEHPREADKGRQGKALSPFKTEDAIRTEYGRIEVVTLADGRQHRGAVVSVGAVYTIITTEGTVYVPMREMSAREIIR